MKVVCQPKKFVEGRVWEDKTRPLPNTMIKNTQIPPHNLKKPKIINRHKRVQDSHSQNPEPRNEV